MATMHVRTVQKSRRSTLYRETTEAGKERQSEHGNVQPIEFAVIMTRDGKTKKRNIARPKIERSKTIGIDIDTFYQL
jgi:hypothetical protein